jgi:hypothetical protein
LLHRRKNRAIRRQLLLQLRESAAFRNLCVSNPLGTCYKALAAHHAAGA